MSNPDIIDLVDSDGDENTPLASSLVDTKPTAKPKKKQATSTKPSLPASIVLEDDPAIRDDALLGTFRRSKQSDPLLLFQDDEYPPLPSSIQGQHKKTQPNCRCRGSQPSKLQYKPNGRPFYACANNNKCKYFSWAYSAESMHWYRFGRHTGHVLVGPSGFAASDLCQGRVGDCWFLSALAVVAERPDLIARLFEATGAPHLDTDGVVCVNLFLDGFWKTVVMDNFLPCMIDSKSENELQGAIQASMGGGRTDASVCMGGGRTDASVSNNGDSLRTSKYDPHALADQCRETLRNTQEFLEQHQQKTLGTAIPNSINVKPLQRMVTSQDLAYSKAKQNQLWVPLLEKAYAKSHGCYSAISGGYIAEAFLDLTGAPTLVYELHSQGFQPRSFWHKLLHYRQQLLPMGCGTDSSAAGIIGMHAYSILDVREVKNVSFSFFQETGVAHGNVSGFTEYDGTVRLLQIRNPHGKGEWKGDFSDQSQIWEKLLQHQQDGQSFLSRSMKNDGTFWIDYDNFLMGFSNVDVVLAFPGNHAKSIPSSFPAKKSNHRCARAFEVSLIDEQPGMPSSDKVELYIMGIQKTRRGASKGRVDRKKSYRVCDLGMLVGKGDEEQGQFTSVKGEMFGFRRDGHYHLVLDRKKSRRVVVMPISFGHPAATDEGLPFVLRFVSDAPLLIRELAQVPRMDVCLQKYCLEAPPSRKQGTRNVILEDTMYRLVQVDCVGNGGGVVFLYLCINETKLGVHARTSGLSFAVEANCRGMSCRTETGLLEHETVAKGKKFEAAWRRYSCEFIAEQKSRLLLVLYQSGQDTEFGSINCKVIATPRKLGSASQKQTTLQTFLDSDTKASFNTDAYVQRGVFNSISGNDAFLLSGRFGSGSIVNYHTDGFQQDMDFELEQALALSIGGTQIPNRDITENDLEFERALKLSKREATNNFTSSIWPGDETETKPKANSSNSYDDDLAKAIQLSMQNDQSKDPVAVVDLTGEEVPGKRKRQDNEGNNSVDDLAEKHRVAAAEDALARLNN